MQIIFKKKQYQYINIKMYKNVFLIMENMLKNNHT